MQGQVIDVSNTIPLSPLSVPLVLPIHPSNDRLFGTSAGIYQHYQQYSFPRLEFRLVPTASSYNSGTYTITTYAPETFNNSTSALSLGFDPLAFASILNAASTVITPIFKDLLYRVGKSLLNRLPQYLLENEDRALTTPATLVVAQQNTGTGAPSPMPYLTSVAEFAFKNFVPVDPEDNPSRPAPIILTSSSPSGGPFAVVENLNPASTSYAITPASSQAGAIVLCVNGTLKGFATVTTVTSIVSQSTVPQYYFYSWDSQQGTHKPAFPIHRYTSEYYIEEIWEFELWATPMYLTVFGSPTSQTPASALYTTSWVMSTTKQSFPAMYRSLKAARKQFVSHGVTIPLQLSTVPDTPESTDTPKPSPLEIIPEECFSLDDLLLELENVGEPIPEDGYCWARWLRASGAEVKLSTATASFRGKTVDIPDKSAITLRTLLLLARDLALPLDSLNLTIG